MNPGDLEKIFHQATRMQIMTELCSDKKEKTFNQVKTACELTDGNLSRHLSTLEKAGTIKITKEFIESKPQTSIKVTKLGRDKFISYLSQLEKLLAASRKKLK